MDHFSFVFTVFFMLLGPLKIIPAFAQLTRGADLEYKRAVAVRGALIATALCAFVALAGAGLLGKYRIQLDAVRIAGGLVLLLSALQGIFKNPSAPARESGSAPPGQLALSPVAVPIIVPHAGVAAILIFLSIAPQVPGMERFVFVCLAGMMAIDFLAMYFIDRVVEIPGLLLALGVAGSVLVFIQACLAVQMILVGLNVLPPVRF